MSYYNFIAIEGPIGVGKSTLAKLISEKYHYHLLQEIVEENPFLSKFYDDSNAWAFQTEMFFLSNRYKQLTDVNELYLQKNKSVISDYHILKNHIFSKMTLNKEQYDKYHRIFNILMEDIALPNVVIYIDADLNTILSRINKRGREIEKNIDHLYLSRLINDYRSFMSDFKRENPDIPFIKIDGNKIDFVNNKKDLNYIFTELKKILNSKKYH